MIPLTTERLVVRELSLDDLGAVDAVLKDDAHDLAQRRRWLEWTVLAYEQQAVLHQPPYGERGIVLKATRELVGLCGFAPCLAPFHQIPGLAVAGVDGYSAEVGLFWAVATAHRRRGYATEAARALIEFGFSHLRLSRIVATTTYANAPSIGVMRKLGMRVERNSHAEPEWLQIVGIIGNDAPIGVATNP